MSIATAVRRNPRLTIISTLITIFVLATWRWYSHKGWVKVKMMSVPTVDLSDTHFNPHPYHPYMSPSYSYESSNVPYTAAIVYLISLRRSQELILSLSYLFSNVPSRHPWPIILFHVGDFTDHSAQTELKRQLYSFMGPSTAAWRFLDRLEFVELHWTLPAGVSSDINEVKPVFDYVWPGYHQMCAFYATEIFDHPRLENVTYYLRLDTDSYIFSPLCYDPFERMASKNLTYAYRSWQYDPEYVVHGLWHLFDDYTRTHTDVEERLLTNGWNWPGSRQKGENGWMDEADFPLYYNNFEIVRLEQFRRKDVRNWLDEIMKDPLRIFKYRWGDAPLRYATVHMFFDVEHEVELFCDVKYYHQWLQEPQCKCEPLSEGDRWIT